MIPSNHHAADWADDTRKVIEKNQADEAGHIDRWQTWLKEA